MTKTSRFTLLIFLLSIFSYGCSNKLYVGKYHQGGVIFFLEDNGKHGLVCAINDLENPLRWDPDSVCNTDALSDNIYSGIQNIRRIISILDSTDKDKMYAAKACQEYTFTDNKRTYNDWYLPSRIEMALICANQNLINETALKHNGTILMKSSKIGYWTSTEYCKCKTVKCNCKPHICGDALIIDFSKASCTMFAAHKNHLHLVRPIRKF